MHPIDQLIAETKAWHDEYSRTRRSVDAAACAIRIQALKEAKKAMEGYKPSP